MSIHREQIKYIMLHPCMCACPTLWDPMDYSPPASSVHGILQARILEWVAVPSSRGSSRSRNGTPRLLCLLHSQEDSLPLAPLGKPSQYSRWFFFFLSFFPKDLFCLSQAQSPYVCFSSLKYSWCSLLAIIQALVLLWIRNSTELGVWRPWVVLWGLS